MNPGELRHRIAIQKINNNVQGDYGEPLDQWINITTVWASINPISGREFFEAEKINSEISHKIKIRYVAGITSSMRVKFNGRIFNIESVINYQERNLELQLMCKELI